MLSISITAQRTSTNNGYAPVFRVAIRDTKCCGEGIYQSNYEITVISDSGELQEQGKSVVDSLD